jgi:RHS repeat-associated protein
VGYDTSAEKCNDKQREAYSKLMYYGARHYHPKARRLMTADNRYVGNGAQGFNRYAHILNNPATLIDPTGYAPADGPLMTSTSMTTATSTSSGGGGEGLSAADVVLAPVSAAEFLRKACGYGSMALHVGRAISGDKAASQETAIVVGVAGTVTAAEQATGLPKNSTAQFVSNYAASSGAASVSGLSETVGLGKQTTNALGQTTGSYAGRELGTFAKWALEKVGCKVAGGLVPLQGHRFPLRDPPDHGRRRLGAL